MTRDEFKLHFILYSSLLCLPLAAALLLIPVFLFFPWLATAQLAPAVWLRPSVCQSLCFCYRLQCLNISSDCLCTHKWMHSLPWLYKYVSQCDWNAFFSSPHKWKVVSPKCHVKLWIYASSCKASKSVIFLHSETTATEGFINTDVNDGLFLSQSTNITACRFVLNHIAFLCPLRYVTWLPVEALVTCQQSAKLEWIHLKLLETVSAQVSFKWNTN